MRSKRIRRSYFNTFGEKMMTARNYLSEESRARAEAALAFHASDARKAYSNQRIPNRDEDLSKALASGVEKLKARGARVIATLTADEQGEC